MRQQSSQIFCGSVYVHISDKDTSKEVDEQSLDQISYRDIFFSTSYVNVDLIQVYKYSKYGWFNQFRITGF